MRASGFKAAFAFAALFAGCAPPAPIVLDAEGVRPSLDVRDLAAVLDAAVDESGRVEIAELQAHADRLDAQLRRWVVTGPRSTPTLFPTPEHVVAYWYNARAAWALKIALACDCPATLRGEQMEHREFVIDGRTMTLAKIDDLLAADGWRTLVASPGLRVTRARMPCEPFQPEGIRRAIRQRFEEFLDDEERFVIDVQSRQVRVPPVLARFSPSLIADYERRYGATGATLTTALLPHTSSSAQRRLQDAIGYAVSPAPPGKFLLTTKPHR